MLAKGKPGWNDGHAAGHKAGVAGQGGWQQHKKMPPQKAAVPVKGTFKPVLKPSNLPKKPKALPRKAKAKAGEISV